LPRDGVGSHNLVNHTDAIAGQARSHAGTLCPARQRSPEGLCDLLQVAHHHASQREQMCSAASSHRLP